jgi:hypothetical protein
MAVPGRRCVMAKVIVSLFILVAIAAVIYVLVPHGGPCPGAYYCPSGGTVQNDNQHYQPDTEHEDTGIIIR